MCDGQLDNKLIVFESSPDFSDNSRALYEYIAFNTEYKTFWVVKEKWALDYLTGRGVACAMIGTDLADAMIGKAKYLVSSSFCFAYHKKPKQIFISAWHAYAIKLVGFFESAMDDLDSMRDLRVITTQADMIITTSKSGQLFTSGMFATDPRKCLITGFPRNDYLYSENGRSNLNRVFNTNFDDANLLLYLPTMRKGLKPEGSQFDDNLFNYPDYDPEAIDLFLEENDAYLIGKLHFADIEKYSLGEFNLPSRMFLMDNRMLVENGLTIYHIMNAFNLLITDYSSVYVDYLLLNRPVVFSCTDIQKYSEDRGLIVDDPRFIMPGPMVKSQQELLSTLQQLFIHDEYRNARENVLSFFHTYKDQHSSERLFKAIVDAAVAGVSDCDKDYAFLYLDDSCPLAQYTTKYFGAIDFDYGDGFDEGCRQAIVYSLNDIDRDGYIKLSFFTGSKKVERVRFCPDRSNRLIVEDFVFVMEKETIAPTYSNGVKSGDRFIFNTNNPQIVLKFEKADKTSFNSISIKFRPIDIAYCGADLLFNAESRNNELQEELNGVYNSKSWKITRPIRFVKNAIAKR